MPAYERPDASLDGLPVPPAEFLRTIGPDLLQRFTRPEEEPDAQDLRMLGDRIDRFTGTLNRRAAVLQRQAEQAARDLANLEAEILKAR